MSKQWQIRRGTTAENDIFTGAQGEVTMDTDKKQLRVHDGQTQGGAGVIDPIVAFQLPTAENNYTWYRKYSSGWVEQGGIQTGSKSIANGQEGSLGSINLPVAMADTNYYGNAQGNDYCLLIRTIKNTSTFQAQFGAYSNVTRTSTTVSWEVKGMAA